MLNRGTRLLLTFFFIALPYWSKAQWHNNFWSRATLKMKVTDRLLLDNEFQHRRQSDYDNLNPFAKNLMFTYRTILHYNHSDNLRFSLQPFSYYANYPVLMDTETLRSSRQEFRFASAVEMKQALSNKVELIQLVGVEYHLGLNHNQNRIRVRTRLGLNYAFYPSLKLNLYDELFINVYGVSNDHIYDHNRAVASITYKIIPNLSLDLGYVFINRLLPFQPTMVLENNFFINVSYLLF